MTILFKEHKKYVNVKYKYFSLEKLKWLKKNKVVKINMGF